MKQILLGFALLMGWMTVAPCAASAAAPAERIPMIVVFHEDQVTTGTEIGPAALAAALPWLPDLASLGYVDSGVVGIVGQLAARFGFRATRVYGAALAGFAANLTPEQISALEREPEIDYVEVDGEMQAVAQTLPYGIDRVEADVSSTRAGDGTGAITNVNAYVLDTGIDRDHPDLNVVNHVNFVSGGFLGLFGEPNDDCNGHGTQVAGVVAARDNNREVVGVAPGAPLTGVKVLGCGGSGPTSGVIQGVDWVTANARRPAIANMSLGGSASQALDNAVRRSAAAGIFYAVAAGNESRSACNSSPARAGAGTNNGIMTVAATDASDREPSFSNYGTCVDIWAPGVSVLSTRNGGGTATASGTSFSSPHVGGGGALALSRSAGSSPAAVEAALRNAAATPGTKSRDGRSVKRLNVASF